MAVIANASRQVFEIPGIRHQTLASRSDGLTATEVWLQTLEAGAETPVHYHECEEVVVALEGSGRVVLGDEDLAFGPGSTLIIPPRIVHQIVNGSGGDMTLVATLSETPGRVFTPAGELLQLPWS